MEQFQADLELSLLHIKQLERLIADQHARVERLKQIGGPIEVADDLLHSLQQSLLLLKQHMVRVAGSAEGETFTLTETMPALAVTRRALAPLLHRLQSSFQLTEAEHALLRSMVDATHIRDVGAAVPCNSKSEAWVIASGWACFERTLSNGHRQIFNFVLPGDTVGIGDNFFAGAAEVVALTPLQLVRADRLKVVVESEHPDYPNLVAACDLERTSRRTQALDHIVRLGSLSASARLAHLLLEIDHRLDAAGLVQDGTFEFPLSQFVIGEAIGLSLVHVNRTVQALRAQGLLHGKQGFVSLPDKRRLAEVAGLK